MTNLTLKSKADEGNPEPPVEEVSVVAKHTQLPGEEGENGKTGLSQLQINIRALPGNLAQAVLRHGKPDLPRVRSQAVFGNLFLHIHSIRTHRWSLKKSFTMGLGVAVTALFLILLVTGVMLMVYYKPTGSEAYKSIKDIHYVVTGGRLLRNGHRWAAHLMVIGVLVHMARVFYTHSYQKPREFNWLVGIGLLVLTFALSFTGYCLPWDQLAYWAVVIGSNIAASPAELTDALNITHLFDFGDLQQQVLLGARTVGDDALIRFYWLHCIVLPLLTIVLMGIHFWRIRKDGGLSRPDDISPKELNGIPKDEVASSSFSGTGKTYSLMCVVPDETMQVNQDHSDTVQSWPHAFRAEMAVFMIIMALVLAFGLAVDAPLKETANPLIPENPAKAPWYFLGLQEIVSYSAFAGGIAIPALVVMALAAIPFLDRERRNRGRWPSGKELKVVCISLLFASACVVAILAFRINAGWLRDWIPGVNQLWIILFNPGTVLSAAFVLYSLIVIKRTASTRLGAAAFFSCFVAAYILLTYFGTVHRGPNWEFYWWPSLWPGH